MSILTEKEFRELADQEYNRQMLAIVQVVVEETNADREETEYIYFADAEHVL
jgi:hypothetical protein